MKAHHSLKHGESLLESLTCDFCGESFTRSESTGSGDKDYCCWECMSKDRENQVSVTCVACGENFSKRKSDAKKVNNHYCSFECVSAHRSEGKNSWEDSKKAEKLKKEVYDRDGYQCRDCDYDGRELHAHHIDGRAEHPNKIFDKDNLVTLCIECHADRHEEKGQEQIANLIRSSV
jgi:5-methylcytosine-specific restriction endonuclease McrA